MCRVNSYIYRPRWTKLPHDLTASSPFTSHPGKVARLPSGDQSSTWWIWQGKGYLAISTIQCSLLNTFRYLDVNDTVKDLPVDHKGMISQVFSDRFNYIETWDLLRGICGSSRQVVSHGCGLSRQVSLCKEVTTTLKSFTFWLFLWICKSL